jgi:hypothetical protein
MKTSRCSEAQITAILRQAEGGVPVADVCREHGMSNLLGSGTVPGGADTSDRAFI